MISIGLDKDLDIKVYKDFRDFSFAGADFGARIKRDHPNLAIKNHQGYIEQYYFDHVDALEKSREELTLALEPIQEKFFEETSKLFGVDFNNETYNGYVSIFDCNPRFVDKNIFQIFFQKGLQERLGAAFHESLHFMFFKYCDLKLSEETRELDKNSGQLWEISEIFNVIALNLPKLRAFLRKDEKLFYPELTEKLEKAKRFWQKTGGDVFLLVSQSLSNGK